MSLKKVEGLRAQVAALKSERETLSALHANVAELGQSYRAWLRVASESTERTVRSRLLAGEFESLMRVRPMPDGTVDLGPVMLRLFGPDVISDALLRHVADEAPTPTAAERAVRLAEIEREALALEVAEEAALEALEQAGTPVARRADADPRAVLGVHD
jgi:hypothetical protein